MIAGVADNSQRDGGSQPTTDRIDMKTASEEVMDMIFLSKWSSQTLCAGAELGVFDCLSRDNTRTAGDVATETGLDATLLYRLLRALASLGLLNEGPERAFSLTDRGAVLHSDAPGSLRYMAMLEGGPEHWAIWNHVTAMVRDGRQNAFLREYGEMAFAYARANPDGYGAIFGRAMSGFSVIQSAWALDALRNYDLSSAATWCDVAGGHGHMMSSFLAAYPHLTGTVLDLPEVLAEKEQLWAGRLGLEERCRYVAADMFEEVPCTADVYSLKMILHDWNESECTRILQTIRRRAKPDSRIFIIEHIVPGPSESHFSKLFDIHMMCWGSGRERTEEEYASLLEASGWRFVACHYPSHARIGVVEGVAF
jgi:O-methyltransferase domain/Dimerisation domain